MSALTAERVVHQLSDVQDDFVHDTHRYALFLGGIGAGKSHAGAVKALVQEIPRGPRLGLVIAPTYPMLRDATWRTALEIWEPLIAQVVRNEMRIVLVTGAEVLFRSADEPDRLRGPNASWAWIDEAAQCHPATWLIAIGRLRQAGDAGRAWLTTTPKGMNWVFETFVRRASADTTIFRSATWANPFLDDSFVSSLTTQYEGDFARQELEAEFVADVEGALLEWRWLDAAAQRPAAYDPDLPVHAGVDVAGPGDDETVLCVRQADAILHLQAWSQSDARGSVIAALLPWQECGLDTVNVDVAGLGHYFALALEDAGLPVVRVNVGESPKGRTDADVTQMKATYLNLRAQVFWSFREWAEAGMLAGLTDQTTLAQLSGIHYSHDNRGRIVIEKKADARKRGEKSPDRAEAVVLAFWSAPKSLFGPALARAMGRANREPSPRERLVERRQALALQQQQRRGPGMGVMQELDRVSGRNRESAYG